MHSPATIFFTLTIFFIKYNFEFQFDFTIQTLFNLSLVIVFRFRTIQKPTRTACSRSAHLQMCAKKENGSYIMFLYKYAFFTHKYSNISMKIQIRFVWSYNWIQVTGARAPSAHILTVFFFGAKYKIEYFRMSNIFFDAYGYKKLIEFMSAHHSPVYTLAYVAKKVSVGFFPYAHAFIFIFTFLHYLRSRKS